MDMGGMKKNPNTIDLLFPVLRLLPAIELKSRPASPTYHVFCKGKYLLLSILFYSILPCLPVCKLLEFVPANNMLYHTG